MKKFVAAAVVKAMDEYKQQTEQTLELHTITKRA
jgi:hypothetical protein